MELIQSFRVFHNLMITSREIFKKASANFTLFVEQQNIIYQVNIPFQTSDIILRAIGNDL